MKAKRAKVKRTKAERRERRKRLRQLGRAVGKWLESVYTGPEPWSVLARLSPELRAVESAYESCKWDNISAELSDTDAEAKDGSASSDRLGIEGANMLKLDGDEVASTGFPFPARYQRPVPRGAVGGRRVPSA